MPDCPNEKQVTVLVTVLGNLIENALDAMSGQAEGEIGLLLHYQDGWLSGLKIASMLFSGIPGPSSLTSPLSQPSW